MTARKQKAVLAQLVERVAFNHVVVGSSPTDGVLVLGFLSIFLMDKLKLDRYDEKNGSKKIN